MHAEDCWFVDYKSGEELGGDDICTLIKQDSVKIFESDQLLHLFFYQFTWSLVVLACICACNSSPVKF